MSQDNPSEELGELYKDVIVMRMSGGPRNDAHVHRGTRCPCDLPILEVHVLGRQTNQCRRLFHNVHCCTARRRSPFEGKHGSCHASPCRHSNGPWVPHRLPWCVQGGIQGHQNGYDSHATDDAGMSRWIASTMGDASRYATFSQRTSSDVNANSLSASSRL